MLYIVFYVYCVYSQGMFLYIICWQNVIKWLTFIPTNWHFSSMILCSFCRRWETWAKEVSISKQNASKLYTFEVTGIFKKYTSFMLKMGSFAGRIHMFQRWLSTVFRTGVVLFKCSIYKSPLATKHSCMFKRFAIIAFN